MPKIDDLQFRNGTAAEWSAANSDDILLGEPCYEKDTGKMKIGDGVNSYNDLPYFTPGGGDSVDSYTNKPFASTIVLPFDGKLYKTNLIGGFEYDHGTVTPGSSVIHTVNTGAVSTAIPITWDSGKTYVDGEGVELDATYNLPAGAGKEYTIAFFVLPSGNIQVVITGVPDESTGGDVDLSNYYTKDETDDLLQDWWTWIKTQAQTFAEWITLTKGLILSSFTNSSPATGQLWRDGDLLYFRTSSGTKQVLKIEDWTNPTFNSGGTTTLDLKNSPIPGQFITADAGTTTIALTNVISAPVQGFLEINFSGVTSVAITLPGGYTNKDENGTISGAKTVTGSSTAPVIVSYLIRGTNIQWFFPGTSGLPTGGTANQTLIKNSGTEGDASWFTKYFLPTGGTTNQVLSKNSGTDGDVSWVTKYFVPVGGTTGQALVKASNADGDTTWSTVSGGGGSGTVTSFSAGDLSELFTTSEATPTTTPALTFAPVNKAANLFYAGPSSGSAAAPAFRAMVNADLPANVVTDPKLAQMPANTVKMNNTGVTADPQNVAAVAYMQRGRRTTVNDTNYSILSTDEVVAYTNLTTGRTATLPDPSTVGSGAEITVSDETGTAGTNNITIATAAGTVVGTASISSNNGNRTYYSNGSNKWFLKQ